jgi:16S rRNA (guanine527-N7)-methyltransferase
MSDSIAADAKSAVDLFATGLNRWNIDLGGEARRAFETYAEMLVDWNANRFNLTRLISPEQIALNHFLDSMVLTQIAKAPAKITVIDVGTGAGFPGLAFKIFRQDINLVLVESTQKKLTFCKAVAEAIGLTNIEFIHGRAEEPTVIKRLGQTAEIVTARAVAPLRTLIDWTAPLVVTGGTIVAWKGTKVYEEVSEAKRTADKLGLKMEVIEKQLAIDGVPPVTRYYVVISPR